MRKLKKDLEREERAQKSYGLRGGRRGRKDKKRIFISPGAKKKKKNILLEVEEILKGSRQVRAEKGDRRKLSLS